MNGEAQVRRELIERIKALAEEYILISVDFLDHRGALINNPELAEEVRLGFSNGEELTISLLEFHAFKDFKFRVGSPYRS